VSRESATAEDMRVSRMA